MSYFLYEQSTGKFYDCTHTSFHLLTTGYSGKGIGRNGPSFQSLARTGPIPQGCYHASPARTHQTLGPVAIRLSPFKTNTMFGRSAFLIHGDNGKGNQSASEGCIILDRATRQWIDASYIHGREQCYITVVGAR